MPEPPTLPPKGSSPKNIERLVQWEETNRTPFSWEREENAERLLDPRDAILLAEYMACGDPIRAAQAVGYEPELAARIIKSGNSVHWMRRMQKKRLARLNIDADEIILRLHEMHEIAFKRWQDDPKATGDRNFAKDALMDLATLIGLTKTPKDQGPSHVTNQIVFGPAPAPIMAGSPNPQSPIQPVPRRDDVPGGIQPGVHRGMEPALPEPAEDVHEPA